MYKKIIFNILYWVSHISVGVFILSPLCIELLDELDYSLFGSVILLVLTGTVYWFYVIIMYLVLDYFIKKDDEKRGE